MPFELVEEGFLPVPLQRGQQNVAVNLAYLPSAAVAKV